MTIDPAAILRITALARWMLGRERPEWSRVSDAVDAAREFDERGDEVCRRIEAAGATRLPHFQLYIDEAAWLPDMGPGD